MDLLLLLLFTVLFIYQKHFKAIYCCYCLTLIWRCFAVSISPIIYVISIMHVRFSVDSWIPFEIVRYEYPQFPLALVSYFNYTVKCSFFSWFNDSQHNGDMDEIQDEVKSPSSRLLDEHGLFLNQASADSFLIIDTFLCILCLIFCSRLLKLSRMICGQIPSHILTMYALLIDCLLLCFYMLMEVQWDPDFKSEVIFNCFSF